jgi:tetratricopeptide (TPR) repeat protein
VAALPDELVKALAEHNGTHREQERIRLRMALHAGEVSYDDHGVTAAAVNVTFRLLDAGPLKAALAGSPGVLALVVSSWFFDEVVRHSVAGDPATYRPVWLTVKETTTVGWIALPDHPYPPRDTPQGAPLAMSGISVPRQLPAQTAQFVGRAAELETLTGLMDQAAGTGGTVVISAIDGTAGIGKTALAVFWAHRVARQFPDGQLYVNLRGFDPAGPPVQPAEAIRGFLDAFEVEPGRIPVSPEAQAGLYRSLLAGRRVLVLLDNARDVGQVRPLLPGSETCVVLVTSRSQLTGLVAADGACPLTVGQFTISEAHELLTRRLGSSRVAAEPEAVRELISFCAGLPLALAIVAARAVARPGFPLAVPAGELRDARERLDALDAGDAATNVRAVFSWSYRYLDETAARMFRLLGVHRGPDISLSAAASLAGIPLKQAREALNSLVRAHLVAENVPGRFAFHDLLRTYAAELAAALDSEAERRAAIGRVLDHYLHTGYTAALLLTPTRNPLTRAPHDPAVTPDEWADHAQALAWFEDEYTVLLAAIAQAAATGFDTHAWQLPWTLAHFFDRRGHWHDWAATHRTALAAARRLGDRLGQAHAHHGLGAASLRLASYDDAHTHHRRAYDLYGELGDRAGQAHSYRHLSWVHESQGRHADALDYAQQAVDLYRELGHRGGEAEALGNVGWCHAQLGNHQQAIACCRKAIALHRELGNRMGEATALDSLGYARHHLGQHLQAIACYQSALDLHREFGNRYEEAATLTHLGDTHHAIGDPAAARDAWEQALGIFEDLRHSDADQVRAKLSQSHDRG